MIHTMPQPAVPPGGAPVGHVSELPELESTALAVLRLWRAGRKQQLADMFHNILGPRDGAEATEALATFMACLASGARRPFAFHGPDCTCYGGDESAMTRMIASAAFGDGSDAALLALHLAPAVAAECLLHRAAWLGAALAPVANAARDASDAAKATRH